MDQPWNMNTLVPELLFDCSNPPTSDFWRIISYFDDGSRNLLFVQVWPSDCRDFEPRDQSFQGAQSGAIADPRQC